MAVPAQLLQQLLALDESVRLELAHALLDSVETRVEELSDAECAALERSLAQADAGQTIPFDQVMAALRAKRNQAMR